MAVESSNLQRWATVVPMVIAALGFVWGVYQYFQGQKARSEQVRLDQDREAVQRRIEARRPFLERQLALYTEATHAAATIATSTNAAAVASARTRFDELYWGELALVEDSTVEQAMMAYRSGLEREADRAELQQLSLGLAVACRDSLAVSWDTPVWKSHYPTPLSEDR
ncbi:MAG: hypothetical protein JWN66_1732 [Sphingomonas bacterium]|uniref:hypothetical protein n=1 Tax=Sphingomonas bacterium TaxID=1895847 RepID=UPI00263887AC|nr:hypothetical protein [Sphingomonas bacterium]MDB5704616.1 hypothetical protein [Sphingomonas bacterium]